jgi:hypothetical protein
MGNYAEDSPDLVQTPLVENIVLPDVFETGNFASEPLLGPRTDFPSRE